jgi:hypothetical protein|tara:strand:+ start:314 stop:484 length:171 start_codon:yes stop_codon:yes gene_type:complete
MSSTFEEIREQILNNYDVDFLCELLGITSESLVDRYEDLIMKNLELFETEDDDNDE